jgi:tight adherence protein B
MRRVRLAAFLAGAVACCVSAWASAQDQTPVFRSRVEAVRVDVSVMNGTAPVLGLTAANFVLADRGVPQVIDSVSVDTVPLSITLILDTSGSLGSEGLANLTGAARGLVESLKPEDSAALLAFNDPAELLVPLSTDRGSLLKALGSLKAEGATSLHDAIFLGLQMRSENTDARSVALIFSDGRDVGSWLGHSSVVDTARRSGVVTHVVELVPPAQIRRGLGPSSRALNEIADAGGGRRWAAGSSRDLRELFAKVLQELRSRYLLTYYPANVTRDGWHDVKVTLKGARGEVIARPGYFVTPAP